MRTSIAMLGIAILALAACSSDDSSTPASSKTTCQTICDCECGTDGTCLSACNGSCPSYSTACQDCTLNVGCAALKGVQGPAPQCSTQCK
jgi:hypothetical protein